jgi:uncharacterized protein (TIGR03437 family)
MRKSTQLIAAAAGGLLPIILFSYATGPDPRNTGAPGDQTCARSGCHTGTALNGGGGNIVLTSSTGNSYTPGQQQTLTLTITDSKARAYGFQASARVDSNATNGQAGTFTASPTQYVLCDNGRVMGSSGCPANSAVQFIEHSRPYTTNTITFQWTAPASDVGPVTIYAAANAANNNGNETGDHIYTTKLQLSPASTATASVIPKIAAGGVVSASAFQSSAVTAPGSWLEIFGANLAAGTRGWAGPDFTGNSAPTSLDNVGVTVGGKAAYVAYISPTQVNVLVPDGVPIGSGVPVVVTSGGSSSDPVNVNTADLAPAILAPSSFTVGGKQYVVATLPTADGSVVYAGPAGAVAGANMRPAKPGEVITLYGIGFGPVSPATTPGTIAQQLSSLTNPVTVQFGSTPATVQYAGLAPGFVGLYQFNVQVPNVVAGDWPLVVTVNGSAVAQNVYITTGQ